MRKILLSITGLLLLNASHAQAVNDTVPTLTGKISISILKGTMDCDIVLKDIPRMKDYFIRLNGGLNIRYFKNQKNGNHIYYDKSFSDTLSSGESSAYYFADNTGKAKFLPDSLHMRYVGMFPVVSDTIKEYARMDWKGNIAFNGYSVRADGAQSAWYPIMYDIKRDIGYNKVRYDLDINCEDCSVIYINGSDPLQASKGHFKSDTPVELTIYAGNYKVAKMNKNFVLNPDMNDSEIQEFGKITSGYQQYYEKHLGIPYEQSITYVQTTPVSKDNAWLFVSYPTIYNIGYGKYGMKSFVDKEASSWFRPYMAHELAHYYFSARTGFNSTLGDMMSEGFSEYLSLKIAKDLISDSIQKKKVSEKLKELKEFKPVPFARVTSHNDYENRDLYVYYYAPLIFLSMEHEFGEALMWKWMKAILAAPKTFTDYKFLEGTLNGVFSKEQIATINSKYFDSGESIANLTLELEKPSAIKKKKKS